MQGDIYMDTSAILKTLLGASSIQGIGQAANANTDTVKNVLSAAVPMLLQGVSQQANNSSTAQGITQALADHAKADTSNVASFLKGVDLSDGAKIITHLLGKNATGEIAKAAGTTSSTAKSILSAAAPLFMSLLGQQTSGTSASSLGNLVTSALGNANVASLIGGLLGGSSSSSGSSSNSSAAGSLLGGLMGLLK